MADTAHPELTTVESDFLDAGAAIRHTEREAAERQANQQVRIRRRTRFLVTGVAALLVAALVAGGLAFRQRQQREAADLAAALADATRVDDAARNAPAADQALLLAVEANRLHDSPDTRSVLADILADRPALIRSVPTSRPVQGLALSPDGRTLLVGQGDDLTTEYRTDTLEPTASFQVAGWTINFRPDGRQLLLVGRGAGGWAKAQAWRPSRSPICGCPSLHHLPVRGVRGVWIYANDAAYSADGRFLAVYVVGFDHRFKAVDSAVQVWDVAALDQPLLSLHGMPAFAVALSPDGTVLYIGSRDPALVAVDVATRRTVRSVELPAAIALQSRSNDVDASGSVWDGLSDGIEVTPDGRTMAVAEGQDLVLYDTATFDERRMLRGHNALVRSLEFSRDGSLLVSGADDHTARVWDVATGSQIGMLTGHTGAVLGVALSPDGGTLYTGGLDSRVLTWDLDGRRQLVSRVVDGTPHTTLGGIALPSHDGESVVYVGGVATGETVRFLDVRTGRLHDAVLDRGGDPLAAWLPPDDRRVATVAGSVLRVRERTNDDVSVQRTVSSSVVTAVAATPDGDFVVAGDRAGEVRRLDVDTLASAGQSVQLGRPVSALATAGKGIAVALLDDKTYAVVDLLEGTVLGRRELSLEGTAVAVSPDGGRIAVGGSGGEVGLIDMDSLEWTATPRVVHRQHVSSITFAADGRTFVSSAFDGGVVIWDGDSGVLVAGVPIGQDQSPAMVGFLPDNVGALVATRNGAVYRLDVRFDRWTAFACAVAGRNLTIEEWQTTFGDEPYRVTCPG